MKKTLRFLGVGFSALAALTLAACLTMGAATVDEREGEASSTGETAVSTALWTGDGGQGKSIAILAPRATGLDEAQGYLPFFVQGDLVSNFSAYSAMSVLDRENLDKQYAELFSGYYDDDSTELDDFGHLVPTDYLLGGNITKTATGYALQLTITNNSDKSIAGSYSGTSGFIELDNLSAVRQASLDLLSDLKVELTERAKMELGAIAEANYVGAQTALARGINAQKSGTEVEALSYYFTASALDANLAEATSRSEIMFANVSSGNIGDDTRNDIAWRRDWIARLTETEQYFDNLFKTNSVPYTLFYSTEIIPGNTNYERETRDLSINVNLRPVGSWVWFESLERALQAVNDGLTATKMKDQWGLGRWPGSGVTDLRPFRDKDVRFDITAELLNSAGKTIGTAEFRMNASWGFSGTRITVSSDARREVRFTGVNANDITDTLTIRIARVNGMDAEASASAGILQIKAISKEVWETNTSIYRLDRNVITRYNGSGAYLVIPKIWDEPVLAIGDEVFRNKGLTSVTIPEGVTSIGEAAFYDNRRLSRVILPDSVRTIGDRAFVYPGDFNDEWYGNTPRSGMSGVSITIGADVTMGQGGVIGNRQHNGFLGVYTTAFLEAYKTNGKGTYTLTWKRQGLALNLVWVHMP